MSKTKVFFISFLMIPLSVIGSLIGVVLSFILSWNRYEPLFDIYTFSQPFIMGWAGGYVSYYVIYKIVKSNEHFFALITAPLIFSIVSIFVSFFMEGETLWQFYASTITSIATYIYFIKKAD